MSPTGLCAREETVNVAPNSTASAASAARLDRRAALSMRPHTSRIGPPGAAPLTVWACCELRDDARPRTCGGCPGFVHPVHTLDEPTAPLPAPYFTPGARTPVSFARSIDRCMK